MVFFLGLSSMSGMQANFTPQWAYIIQIMDYTPCGTESHELLAIFLYV